MTNCPLSHYLFRVLVCGLLYMYSGSPSVIAATDNSLFLIFFMRSWSPVDSLITYKNIDVKSSAAVIVSNSQFLSTSSVRFQALVADSPSSRFRSKKSALLCWTFHSGVRNSVFNLCNGSELGSLSLSLSFFWSFL